MDKREFIKSMQVQLELMDSSGRKYGHYELDDYGFPYIMFKSVSKGTRFENGLLVEYKTSVARVYYGKSASVGTRTYKSWPKFILQGAWDSKVAEANGRENANELLFETPKGKAVYVKIKEIGDTPGVFAYALWKSEGTVK